MSFSWVDFQHDYSLIGHSSSPKKCPEFKSSIFSQIKKKRLISKKILSFWLRHHVSSTKVIIGSFALNFSHQQFIITKKLIFLGSQMAPSTKTWKIQVTKGLSSNNKTKKKKQKKSLLKQKEIFLLFWWSYQVTSINVIIVS